MDVLSCKHYGTLHLKMIRMVNFRSHIFFSVSYLVLVVVLEVLIQSSLELLFWGLW